MKLCCGFILFIPIINQSANWNQWYCSVCTAPSIAGSWSMARIPRHFHTHTTKYKECNRIRVGRTCTLSCIQVSTELVPKVLTDSLIKRGTEHLELPLINFHGTDVQHLSRSVLWSNAVERLQCTCLFNVPSGPDALFIQINGHLSVFSTVWTSLPDLNLLTPPLFCQALRYLLAISVRA